MGSRGSGVEVDNSSSERLLATSWGGPSMIAGELSRCAAGVDSSVRRPKMSRR